MRDFYLECIGHLPRGAKTNDAWVRPHIEALYCPHDGAELAFVQMLSGWLRYADIAWLSGESGIGADYVLGPCWASIGSGLRGLLNGNLGRLDAGTLDTILRGALECEEFDPEAQ